MVILFLKIGDTTETLCDVVLLATGYKMSFPFLSDTLLPTDGNRVRLYKYVFSPALKHPKTLAFIALVQPLGAVFPIAELQSRWFAGLMANRRTLPYSHRMNEDIERKERFQKRFYSSQRHTIQVDWIPFMDELADEVGVRPNLWKYVFSDFQLWKALMFGPALPYQYRLEGIPLEYYSDHKMCEFFS